MIKNTKLTTKRRINKFGINTTYDISINSIIENVFRKNKAQVQKVDASFSSGHFISVHKRVTADGVGLLGFYLKKRNFHQIIYV